MKTIQPQSYAVTGLFRQSKRIISAPLPESLFYRAFVRRCLCLSFGRAFLAGLFRLSSPSLFSWLSRLFSQSIGVFVAMDATRPAVGWWWPVRASQYRMKTPWRDGTTHVIMSDGELVEKLAALVPAPRFHLVRYFGILASAAKQRPSIVPVPPPASRVESCGHRDTSEKEKPHARNYYSWSQLMARIFAVDVLECPQRIPHYVCSS